MISSKNSTPKNLILIALCLFLLPILHSCKKDNYVPSEFEHDNYLVLTFSDDWIGREASFRITEGEVFVDLNGNQLQDKNERLQPDDNRDVSFVIPSKEVRIYGNFIYFSPRKGNILTLDISNHPTLEYLMGGGRLMDVKAKNNTSLRTINTGSSRFNNYDFSQFPNLESVVLPKAQLTSVDFSKNPKLSYLDVSGNQLTSLNLSQNKAITRVDIYSNKFNQASMQTFINSLPTAKPDKHAYAVVYSTNHPNGVEENKITKAQVAQMKVKGWGVHQRTFHENGSTESEFVGL